MLHLVQQQRPPPLVEGEKLRAWERLLVGAEAELGKCLTQLSGLPDRRHVETWIDQLTLALQVIRDGPRQGEPYPMLLRDWLRRHRPALTLEALGREPRVDRSGLRATRARLEKLERENVGEPG